MTMITQTSFTYHRIYPVKCAQCGKMLFSKEEAEEHKVDKSTTTYAGGRRIVNTNSTYTVPMCKECHKRVSKIESRGCLMSFIITLVLLSLSIFLACYTDALYLTIAAFIGMWIYIAFAKDIIDAMVSNDKKEHNVDYEDVDNRKK